ncbi:MAG: hypothetical protein KatS3mg031_1621 [Chitinophagales bacterium]|nr:MAG: hypothetical protein KatS3mg031_1621 [Chitinophagales bacterium]
MAEERYFISLDNTYSVVRVVAHGNVSVEMGKKIISEARVFASRHRLPILYDVTQAEVAASPADWYAITKELPVLTDLETRNIRVAILVSEANRAQYEFYETVAYNSGLLVKLFTSEQQALAWLKK